jgi:NTP pyrophosphatase (non-canonical NTP hydrolase)
VNSTILQAILINVWSERRDAFDESTEQLLYLVSRVGKLARTLLQGTPYKNVAIDVAVTSLQIYERDAAVSSTLHTLTIHALDQEIARGRAKFPKNDLMLAALTEELGELADALESERPDDIRREALQVAAVAVRIAEEGDTTFVGASEESKQP